MRIFVSGGTAKDIDYFEQSGFKVTYPETKLENKHNIMLDLRHIKEADVIVVFGDDFTWAKGAHFFKACFLEKPTIVIGKDTDSFESWFATDIVPGIERAVNVLSNWQREFN